MAIRSVRRALRPDLAGVDGGCRHQYIHRTTRRQGTVINRLRGLGIVLGIIGLAFVVAGGFAFLKVQEGQTSLKAFSAAQGVELSYNEDGQLVDRGETEGAQAIMS